MLRKGALPMSRIGLFFLYAMSSGFLPGVGRDAEHIVTDIESRPGWGSLSMWQHLTTKDRGRTRGAVPGTTPNLLSSRTAGT